MVFLPFNSKIMPYFFENSFAISNLFLLITSDENPVSRENSTKCGVKTLLFLIFQKVPCFLLANLRHLHLISVLLYFLYYFYQY